jgi:antitoxin CptB
MDRETRLKRLKFRAWHRGTREADTMVGGFFDARSPVWTDADLEWFESFLEEQDVDIMAWGLKSVSVPTRLEGPMMQSFQRLDFIPLPH